MHMRQLIAIGLAGSTLLPSASMAQNLQDRVEALEKTVQEQKKSLAEALGLEIHALAAVDYNYNFNNPDSRVNKIHVFDEDANTFSLDDVYINVQRNVPEGLGFLVDVDFGQTAEVLGRATRWSNGSSSESDNSFELRQAYLKYTFPGTPFNIEAGKFVTFHGAEVIKTYNNLNYNVSNSILFGYAIPFTHTGLLGTYTFPNELGSFAAGIVNGWDNVVDNNDGKSVHTMLTLTPNSIVTFGLSGTYGPEQNDNGESKRLLITPLVTIKPADQWTFILDYDYGNESNIALSDGEIVRAPGNAMWQGVAAYAVFAPTDRWQLALRGEVFDDPDGVRTLFQEPGFGPGATFWEVTQSVAYKITDGLTCRAEYRHDESDKTYFDNEHRASAQRGQDIVATELVYAF
jgi:hypothetical protein